MKFVRQWRTKVKDYIKSLVSLDLPPHTIALSFAAGIFIGVFIPMGLQTVALMPVVLLLRINVAVAWSATLISNPVTILPLYAVCAFIGEKITGILLSADKLNKVAANPTFTNIRNLGIDAAVVILTGSFILGATLAIIFYYLSLKLINNYRKKITQRSGIYPRPLPDNVNETDPGIS